MGNGNEVKIVDNTIIASKDMSNDSIDAFLHETASNYILELRIPKNKKIPCGMLYELTDLEAKLRYKNNESGTEIEHTLGII